MYYLRLTRQNIDPNTSFQQMNLTYFWSQSFGIPASITLSMLVWLSLAAVVHCSTVSNDIAGSRFICKQDSLVQYLREYNTWPYQHVPYFGYLDSYGNKLMPITKEPYAMLFVLLTLTYLIWYRIAIYLRKHYAQQETIHRSAL